MPTEKTIHVKATWDAEAEVWVAESDDVPGLITEANAWDRLMEKLRVLGDFCQRTYQLACPFAQLLRCNDGYIASSAPVIAP
ncbi:MAG: protein of unknown function (DUF1902) [Candidatus Kentron sp. G]|nr:MAG: protein of unknown function (DUF1902) [Candidatus Kentron sp. G]